MFILNGIHLSRFLPFAIEEKHVYIVMTVMGILVSFVIIRPVVHWLVVMKFTKLLCYMISSLLIVAGFFVFILIVGGRAQSYINLLKIILQSLAVFGIGLLITNSYQRLTKKPY